MNDIVSASLDITGATSLDMNLDFVEVPAPGVPGLPGIGLPGIGLPGIGLPGIGLAGIALVARRRRDTDASAV